MKIKFGLVLLIFIFVFVGCNSNPKQETDNKISKEIISLQGQSDHWTANYTIRETEKVPKHRNICSNVLLNHATLKN